MAGKKRKKIYLLYVVLCAAAAFLLIAGFVQRNAAKTYRVACIGDSINLRNGGFADKGYRFLPGAAASAVKWTLSGGELRSRGQNPFWRETKNRTVRQAILKRLRRRSRIFCW